MLVLAPFFGLDFARAVADEGAVVGDVDVAFTGLPVGRATGAATGATGAATGAVVGCVTGFAVGIGGVGFRVGVGVGLVDGCNVGAPGRGLGTGVGAGVAITNCFTTTVAVAFLNAFPPAAIRFWENAGDARELETADPNEEAADDWSAPGGTKTWAANPTFTPPPSNLLWNFFLFTPLSMTSSCK